MIHRLLRIVALGVVALVYAAPLGTAASPGGWAWDSVSKLAQNSGSAVIYPGDFDGDFSVAAQVSPPPDTGGGLMGKLKQVMATGASMTALMENGVAQHHYVAGTKERTDNIAFQTATIVDCAARTVTTLDLAKKTYHVASMDAGSGSSGSGGAPGKPGGDGTKIAISVSNTSLGPLQVSGEPTHGFSSHVKVTETKPSGESNTQTADVVSYFAGFSNPVPQCARFGGAVLSSQSGMQGGQGLAIIAGASRLMNELSSSGADQRFSVEQSGPPMPLGHFSMFDVVSITGSAGHNVNFVTERGHVRSIDPADPIFSVPADFTQTK